MRRIPLASLVFLGVSVAPLFAQQTCQGLTSLALEHATINSATAVPEGPVAGGGRGGAAPVVAAAHCAVQGVIRPTKDSEIHFELWLPASGWNGKYVQLGNGGWAGAINAAGLAEPSGGVMLRRRPTMVIRAAPARRGRSGTLRS